PPSRYITYTLLSLPSLYCTGPPPHLHSFPTRRSSDLSRRAHPLPRRSSRARRSRSGWSSHRVASPAGGTVQVDFASQALCSKEVDRKSTRLNSSHVKISYAVFCLKKKKRKKTKKIEK